MKESPMPRLSSRNRLAIALSIAGAALSLSHALAQPATVYVYNGGSSNQGSHDVYNSGCQGWIFQAMGLLGPNGEPPTVDADNLKNPAGEIVGTVIRDANNNIIGYRSADGTKEAYNVDTSATTAQAWQSVSATGQLIVAKHGTASKAPDGTITGTGITLDGGTGYSGFKPRGGAGGGTGGPGAPYPLPPRPGASVDVYLNSCWSTFDPDGDEAGRKSVGGSIQDVPGVDDGNVTGNEGKIYKGPAIGIDYDDDAALAATEAALEACAREQGFTKKETGEDGVERTVGDPESWIAQLPFDQQLRAAKDCLRTHRVTGARISISYEKSATQCAPGGCAYYEPVQTMDFLGGLFHYQADDSHYFIDFMVPPGAIAGTAGVPVYVHPTLLSDGLPDLPPGLGLASVIVRAGRYDHQPLQLQAPAMLAIEFPRVRAGEHPPIGLFMATPDGWAPIPANIDPAASVAMTQIQNGGAFAVLAPVPPPQRCPADINLDGVVNSQDFFDFLAAFFSGNPTADFNTDGAVNSQDFFDFLSEFFNPCR
jgi:hypothetical protein